MAVYQKRSLAQTPLCLIVGAIFAAPALGVAPTTCHVFFVHMQPRMFPDLARLPDPEFFREVAVGLGHIARNVALIDADARRLSEEKRGRGTRILDAFAAEESAKFLILLDAVRCARHPQVRFQTQLKKMSKHLAKMLYSELCNIRPVDFSEVKRWVNLESEAYYLDGPTGGDWVFRNRMMQAREESLYVDYMVAEGDHYWSFPDHMDDSLVVLSSSKGSVQMVAALALAGLGQEAALAVIADKWRPLQMADDTHTKTLRQWNRETLQELDHRGLLRKSPDETYSLIVSGWPFPLYDLPLAEIHVKPEDLVEKRSRNTEY